MEKEIDRPLGQSAGRGRALSGGRPAPAFLAGVVALLALSTLVAIQRDPLRDPPVEIAAAPAEAPLPTTEPIRPEPIPASAPSAGTTQDSPSIVKVTPQGESPADAPSSNVIVIRDPSSLGQNLRVAHLPDRALLEQSEQGPLPVRGPDGRRASQVYARPWSGARGPHVVIVIGGLGLSQTGTQAAIRKLPPEVTLAFAPQGNSLSRWMQAARQSGHEIVMQIPLEPFDYPHVNPGRNTLRVDAGREENLQSLRWALSRITNYTGVMNYMGGRFVTDPKAMEPVMRELGERGLLYLDDGSSSRSVAEGLAARNDVPFAAGDELIDAVRERGAILKKLDQLEAEARAKGSAIGSGSAFDVTVDAVTSWIAEAKKRGVEIVPVSAVAREPAKG